MTSSYLRLLLLFGLTLIAGALVGCARAPIAETEPLIASQARRDLGCTPLMLVVSAHWEAGEHGNTEAATALGFGSGVLVHPRIILTAAHVVPPAARSVMAFDRTDSEDGAPRGESARIQRVIRGAGSLTTPWRDEDGAEHWGDDWALLILARPFQTLEATPAARVAEGADDPPARGRAIRIAGFPLDGSEGGGVDALYRTGLLVRTQVGDRPAGAPDDASIYFASGEGITVERRGASGGPVFSAEGDAPPALVGVYLGRADSSVLGLNIGRALVIQRVPREAIRAAIESVSGSDGREAAGSR